MLPIFVSLFFLFLNIFPHITSLQHNREHVLSSHVFSLENRYANKQVNEVFKDNIALNLAYLSNRVKSRGQINWNDVLTPSIFEFSLKPGEVFAFHEDVLPEYKGSVVKTTNANFNSQDGFKSDGYLVGDGVCHFASLINWAATEAKLDSRAPTNHDFAHIPDVPGKYGVAIYKEPGNHNLNAMQNLYVRNNKKNLITFRFRYEHNEVNVSVIEKEDK